MALSDLRDVGFSGPLNRSKLAELLRQKYPEHNWEEVYLLRGRYAQQKRLEKAVASLFPVLLPPPPTHHATRGALLDSVNILGC